MISFNKTDFTAEKNLMFLQSAMKARGEHTTGEVLQWIQKKNEEIKTEVSIIPLAELKGWQMDDIDIHHQSGKFFKIQGIRISTNYGLIPIWEQPIINQPEIGFLGFITQKHNGILHFLVQAKIEPGNINCVQLSPTLQATRSNFTRIHGGKAPHYLDYFDGRKDVTILIDQLQSEQGARFFQKRNRNIIVEIPEEEEIPILEQFIWVTLGQIKELMRFPNVVNMDSRTVISCIQYGNYSEEEFSFADLLHDKRDKPLAFLSSILNKDNHLHDFSYILHWITDKKFKYTLEVERIKLKDTRNWLYDGQSIVHKDNKYFSIIGVNVCINNREVSTWDQPMVKTAQEGIIGFLVKKINGIYHFLVQAKLEAGNFDIIELAPTVQCLTGNYRNGYNEYTIPYIEYFTEAKQENIWYAVKQSEEGGRFYREQNLNMIVEVPDGFPIEVDENYCWMTLNQIQTFVAFNNYLNIAARSLLAAIKFI